MSKPKRPRLLIVAGVCGLFLIALLAHRLTVTFRTFLTGCIYESGTGGGLGLYRWAQRMGINVRALEVPVWEAPASLESPAGNCILTMGDGPWSPMEHEVENESWVALRRWLARGNSLMVVTPSLESLPNGLIQNVIGKSEIQDPNSKSLQAKIGKLGFRISDFGSPDVDPDPQTIEIPTTDYGTLTVRADGPRWASETNPIEIRNLNSKIQELASDQRGAVLVHIPIEGGAAYILLDDFAWTNAGLDHGENAQVLWNLVHKEVHGGVLGFDEYRHGHGRTESFLTYLWRLPGAPSVLGIVIISGLLYLYGRNVRLQPIEAYELVERRTTKEYIDAVAGLYERARAAPLAVEAVARRIRHLAPRAAEAPANLEELLRRTDHYVGEADNRPRTAEQRPAYPTSARNLVVELVHLRKQIYGSRTIS